MGRESIKGGGEGGGGGASETGKAETNVPYWT